MAVRRWENRKPKKGRLQMEYGGRMDRQSGYITRATPSGRKTPCAVNGICVLLHHWSECSLCFWFFPSHPSQNKPRGGAHPSHSGPSLTNAESPEVSHPETKSRKALSGVLLYLPLCLSGYGPNSTNQIHTLPSGNTPPWKKRS